jgi:lipopolysaccharide transport system ATP-binding protein
MAIHLLNVRYLGYCDCWHKVIPTSRNSLCRQDMSENPAISVQNISKRYFIGRAYQRKAIQFSDIFKIPSRLYRNRLIQKAVPNEQELWALKNISFDLPRGRRLGIIGKNGAGKTTLLKILSRLVYPTDGRAVIRGRTTSLFGVGTGFKPKLTGRENIYYNASLHGLSKKEIDQKFPEILQFSGLERFIETPIQFYSKGMYARLAFSVAAHLDPEILMLDEVMSGGDMAFQKKCLNKIDGIAESGRTILFVSHNMNSIVSLCDTCIWIEDGCIIESGEPKEVVKSYSKRMMKLQSSYQAPKIVERPIETTNIEGDESRRETGAYLMSFHVADMNGSAKEVFRRDEEISALVTYRILRDDIDIVPVLHLYKNGDHVFSTHPDEILHAPKGSVCRAITSIPGKFLNTGDYDFSVAIVTPARPKWQHVCLENIASIKVLAELNENQIFTGEYRGVVRPELTWKISI